MNNFNLNLFKYFYYVVYYNGFTNASKNLNIAQSSLSYNIKQLELQLDKTLIIRDNKNFELTEDGVNVNIILYKKWKISVYKKWNIVILIFSIIFHYLNLPNVLVYLLFYMMFL